MTFPADILVDRVVKKVLHGHASLHSVIDRPGLHGGVSVQEEVMRRELSSLVLLVTGSPMPSPTVSKAWILTARAFGVSRNSPASFSIQTQSAITDFLRTWAEYSYDDHHLGDFHAKWDREFVLRLILESEARSVMET